jgi:heat shock protein HspQ
MNADKNDPVYAKLEKWAKDILPRKFAPFYFIFVIHANNRGSQQIR